MMITQSSPAGVGLNLGRQCGMLAKPHRTFDHRALAAILRIDPLLVG